MTLQWTFGVAEFASYRFRLCLALLRPDHPLATNSARRLVCKVGLPPAGPYSHPPEKAESSSRQHKCHQYDQFARLQALRRLCAPIAKPLFATGRYCITDRCLPPLDPLDFAT